MVGEWLSDLEGNREVVRECFEKTLSSLIKKRFAADVVDKNFENCDDVDEWLPQLLQQKFDNQTFINSNFKSLSKILKCIPMINAI